MKTIAILALLGALAALPVSAQSNKEANPKIVGTPDQAPNTIAPPSAPEKCADGKHDPTLSVWEARIWGFGVSPGERTTGDNCIRDMGKSMAHLFEEQEYYNQKIPAKKVIKYFSTDMKDKDGGVFMFHAGLDMLIRGKADLTKIPMSNLVFWTVLVRFYDEYPIQNWHDKGPGPFR